MAPATENIDSGGNQITGILKMYRESIKNVPILKYSWILITTISILALAAYFKLKNSDVFFYAIAVVVISFVGFLFSYLLKVNDSFIRMLLRVLITCIVITMGTAILSFGTFIIWEKPDFYSRWFPKQQSQTNSKPDPGKVASQQDAVQDSLKVHDSLKVQERIQAKRDSYTKRDTLTWQLKSYLAQLAGKKRALARLLEKNADRIDMYASRRNRGRDSLWNPEPLLKILNEINKILKDAMNLSKELGASFEFTRQATITEEMDVKNAMYYSIDPDIYKLAGGPSPHEFRQAANILRQSATRLDTLTVKTILKDGDVLLGGQ